MAEGGRGNVGGGTRRCCCCLVASPLAVDDAIDDYDCNRRVEKASVLLTLPFAALTMTTTIHGSSPLDPLFAFLSYALIQAESVFYKIPGSHVIARYVKSSHQNDPGRTVLEILLALFAIRTLLQSRTRADNAEKHFIQFSEKVFFPAPIRSIYLLAI
jgi:hypothetical protein